MKIRELRLSSRAINALHMQNIRETSDLTRYRRDDLLIFPRIGELTVAEIQRELLRHDLYLRPGDTR